MSNSHLFLNAVFPRAPLQNGVGRYVCQLQRIVLKFCKSNGASKGMREFLENKLVDFSTNNPGVVVYVKPRRHRLPVIVGEYLNGDRHWMCVRNNTEEEITKWVELLRTQNGNTSASRLLKLIHTEQPSIQGPWTPYAHANPALNTTTFPDDRLSTPVDIEQSATEKLLEIFEKQKLQQQTTQVETKRGE